MAYDPIKGFNDPLGGSNSGAFDFEPELVKYSSWGTEHLPQLTGTMSQIEGMGPNASGKTLSQIFQENNKRFTSTSPEVEGGGGGQQQYYDTRFGMDPWASATGAGRAYAALKDYGVNPEDYGINPSMAIQAGRANAADWKTHQNADTFALPNTWAGKLMLAAPFAIGAGAMLAGGAAAGGVGGAAGETALSTNAANALNTAGWGVNPATGVGSMANINAAEGLFNAPISSLGTNQGVQAAMQAGAAAGGGAAGGAAGAGAGGAGGGGVPTVEPGGTVGMGAGDIPPKFGTPVGGAGGGAGGGGGGAFAPTAPTAVTGNPTIDSILANNWQNLLKLGVSGASLMMAKSKSDQTTESIKQLQGIGSTAATQGQGLINTATGGALTAPQQANIDRYTQDSKNQVRQHFASIGQFDSTARIQAERLVDQQAEAMKMQMQNQTFDQGAKLLGLAQGPLTNAAQYQMGQDKALVDALGQFALGVGGMFGQQAGKGTTTTPAPQQQPLA